MKTTTIPAQITTVEDKIAGSLNLTQMLMLCAPIFIGGVLFVIMPPLLKPSLAKLVIFISLVFIFTTLSIRIKGKILIHWTVIIGRYNLRPRYFIYNKNDSYLRSTTFKSSLTAPIVKTVKKQQERSHIPLLPMSKLIQLQTVISNPRAKLSIETDRKGGLSVHITEIK